jgi:hypothetical protein
MVLPRKSIIAPDSSEEVKNCSAAGAPDWVSVHLQKISAKITFA